MKVYLAGPIFECEDHECIAWRQEVKKRLAGFVVVDPMETTDYRGETDSHYREIVELDKARIDACDILLVNCIKPSIGTAMEILYAWQQGKRVYVVCRDNPVNPWLLYHAEKTFPSIEAVVSYLQHYKTGP